MASHKEGKEELKIPSVPQAVQRVVDPLASGIRPGESTMRLA